MRLSEIENFVFKKGILGCPLEEVPEDLLDQIKESHALEIVNHSANLTFPTSLTEKTPDSEVHQLDDLETFKDKDLRFKFEMWRRLIFKGEKFHSIAMAMFVQMMLDKPEGVTKAEVYEKFSSRNNRIKEWIDRLKKCDAITVKDDVYIYNIELVDGTIDLPDDLFTSPAYCITFKQAFDLGLIDKIPRVNIPKNLKDKDELPIQNKRGLVKMNLSQLLSPERMQQIQKVIKEYPHGIELGILKKRLRMTKVELNHLVDVIGKDKNFLVTNNGKNPDKISYLGEMNCSFVDSQMVNFLVDICLSAKYFILSELPKDVKKMKTSMNVSEEDFITMLEDNNFSIIEIRSKFVNPEFVAFAPSIESDDQKLIALFDKAKEKLSLHFKTKVKFVFLKNIYMNSFDNNYSPSFKERVNLFYHFIVSQMNINDGYFYLNNFTLLNMKFSTLVRCIPFRSDFQFLKMAQDASRSLKPLRNSFQNFKDKKFDELTSEEFETINRELISIFENYTVADILKAFKLESEEYKTLYSRIDIHEFYRIILALVKYNIFEGFQSKDYYFFEGIKGIEKYVQKILTDIPDDSAEEAMIIIPYPVRKLFYDQISEFPEEEFYERAKSVIETNYKGEVAEFFMKKLNDFK